MRHALLAGTAALAVLATSAAFAQTTVIIQPDQRTRIHDYMVRQHAASAPLQDRVVVGGILPPAIELAPVPDVWGPNLTRYRYVYWNDRIVLVDPATREVVDVID